MKKTVLYAMLAAAAVCMASCAKTREAAEKAEEAVENAADATGDALKTSAQATADAAKETVAKVDDAIEEARGGVIDLNDDNAYRPGTKVDMLTVLDFNATWCGPCKMLAPVFDSTAKAFDGKVRFVSVDIDKCTATAEAFAVEAVPTVVLLRPDGKSERYVGTQQLLPADNFVKIIRENL